MRHDIPSRAIATEYTANHHTGIFYIWKDGDSWYWDALGNNGEAASENLAREAAKRWIRDGQ